MLAETAGQLLRRNASVHSRSPIRPKEGPGWLLLRVARFAVRQAGLLTAQQIGAPVRLREGGARDAAGFARLSVFCVFCSQPDQTTTELNPSVTE